MSEFLEFDGITAASFSVDQERRTLTGTVVPWNKLGRHRNGKTWRFARGGLKYADAKYIRLNEEHVQSARLGRALFATDEEGGLVMSFKVYDGPAGDRALALAENKRKTGFSVEIEFDEMDATPDPENPGALLVNMAHLTGVAFVGNPAFDDARLISVRASINGGETGMDPETTTTPASAPTEPTTQPTPQPAPQPTEPQPTTQPATPTEPQVPAQPGQVAFSDAQFAQFMSQFGQPATPAAVRPTVDPTATTPKATASTTVKEPLAYSFSYEGAGKYSFSSGTKHDFSTDLINFAEGVALHRDYSEPLARLNEFIKSTFADVDTGDIPGSLPTIRKPDMWVPHLDYATPLWDLTGRGALPDGGRKFDIPKFTSASGLVVTATEKVEPAPGAYVNEMQTITPGQLWGKVEITRQAWRQGGNPALSGILWEEMVRSFYEAREAAIATFLGTLTAATDIALPATGATPTNTEKQATVAALEAAISDLQFVRGGNRFRAAATHQSLYRVLSSVQDSSGRPLYPMMAPQNTNGQLATLYSLVTVGGTTFVPAYALGTPSNASSNSWLFDPSRVMAWAGTPERLFWDFGATVQTANIPQLSFVTLGLYADVATANTDINAVRQVTFDPNSAA